MNSFKVAVVEDEELIRTMLKWNLEKQGYEVGAFADAESFLGAMDESHFDAILLDIMMPGMSGRDLLKLVREKAIRTPVLMVTAVSDVPTLVGTLEVGADDYVTKPFNMEELLARVRAVIRRSQGERNLPSDRIVRVGACEVNLETRSVRAAQGDSVLSEKERDLLAYFLRNPGRAISRVDILEEIWGMDVDPTPRTVDNFVLKFRKLFEEDPDIPRHFVTVRSAGYLFEP